MTQQERPDKFARLRQLAQEEVSLQSLGIVGDVAGLSPEDRLQVIEDLLADRSHTVHLVHELWVHQTELEMQHAELQQAQERLQQERDRYMELYHNAPVGYLTTDRRGHIIEMNTTAIRLLDIDQAEPTGHALQEYILPDDQDIYYFHLQNLFETKHAQTSELRVRQRDGSFLFVRLESTYSKDDQDTPCCQTALLDITARRQAEQILHETNIELEQRVSDRTADLVEANARLRAEIDERQQAAESLRTSKARFATFMQHLPGPAFICDQDGRVLFANAACCQNLGRPSAEVIGHGITSLLPPPHADYFLNQNRQVLTEHRVCIFEDQLNLDEQMRVYLSIKFPMEQPDGTCDVGGISIDITDRKQLETDLRHARDVANAANQTKSTFLATMSHELRTPLNAVIGMAALLEGTPLTAEQQEYVTTIHTSSELLLTLISDVLDFSKIEAGRLDLEQHPFDVRSCVHTACNLLNHNAVDKGLSVQVEVAESVPLMVQGDALRVQQILINLLSNAVKFTERGGIVVSVTTVSDAQTPPPSVVLQFSVQDTGRGMSAEQQTRLFQAFTQVDTSITRQYGGTGLGLTISQRLAEAMGGSIQVESVEGQGSTFHVVLQFLAVSDAATLSHSHFTQDSPMALDGSLGEQYPLRVLLVEDNRTNIWVMVRLLEKLGYHADVATNGQEALDAVDGQPYDVILMDVQMPGMDGITATRHIRTRWDTDRYPYIIALTAHSTNDDRQHCLDAGMNDYLSKPVRLEQLAAVLVRTTEMPPYRVP
jgi:PAS domain S-box-containing protein